MRGFFRKSALMVAGLAFAATTMLASAVQAASEKPSIQSIGDIGRTSVTLRVKDADNKGDRMIFRVKIENKATGVEMFKTLEVKLNKDGKKDIVISGLKAGTKYQFKVKDRKRTLKGFTDYSKTKSATTLM